MNDNADNIHVLNLVTRLNLPPRRVLEAALASNVTSVVVMGYDENGNEYFASSIADGGDVLWLMERCKKLLLDVPDRE